MPESQSARAAKPFSAIWCYAWDLLAEGLDASLGRIAEMGLQGICLAVSYHAGMLFLPHNPRQKVRFLEDGSIYFQPRGGHFRGLALQPRVSALAAETDPLEDICQAAARHGLQVVAWTVCCHNSYQGERHPDVTLRNAFGDAYPYALCPSQADVQAYLQALLQELSRYPLRVLQLESYDYMGFPHGHHHEKILMPLSALSRYLLGICFCPACAREAQARNVDVERVRQQVRQHLLAVWEGRVGDDSAVNGREAALEALPALAPFLGMRADVVARLVQRLSQASAHPLSLIGVEAHLEQIAPAIAEVTECAYRIDPQEVSAITKAARARLGATLRLAIGLDASPHLSPSAENLASKVQAAREGGADCLYFYNYGLMPLPSLDWLRRALL